MKDITHTEQQKLWDAEHTRPNVLLQMDSEEASNGVKKFWDFLKGSKAKVSKGLEMGCGKGRNVIWLAEQGVEMHGFDFSAVAITEAKNRAEKADAQTAHFRVQDATKVWDYDSNYFDFAIDCFASTDIESPEGRMFAISEFMRVLKPGGYLLAYLLSTDDEFHKEMIQKNPAKEKNTFFHPTGKFEKVFNEEEIREQYKDFRIVKWERIEKTTEFYGKEYDCKHFWIIFQKAN